MDSFEEVFKQTRTIAVVGLSDSPERESFGVAQYLRSQGYRIIPVNPTVKMALGEKSYPDLRAVPGPIDLVNVFRRPELIPDVVDRAIEIGAKAI